MTQQIYRYGDHYTGARATLRLVGQADNLAQMAEIFHAPQSSIVYLTGLGGTGKTRFIQELLDQARTAPEQLIAADELIDLYHTRVRSSVGFISAMMQVVPPLREFLAREEGKPFDERFVQLMRAEQEGLGLFSDEFANQLQENTKMLIGLVNEMTQGRRLVIGLDTAERLFVAPDPAQEKLGLQGYLPSVLEWLLDEFLPALNNVVVVIAGRPEPMNLSKRLITLAEKSGKAYHTISQKGLTEEGALDYFDALVEVLEKADEPGGARTLKTITQLSEQDKRVTFHVFRDDGDPPRIRPILLAIAIDHLALSGAPMAAFNIPLADAKQLTSEQRRANRKKLSGELMNALHNNALPLDDVIRALGWLRKGADESLLSRLLDVDVLEIRKAVEYIQTLSFIKKRPADDRLFLHDEMYEMMQRHGVNLIPSPDYEEVYERIRTHLTETISQARRNIYHAYRPQADRFQDVLPKENIAYVRETRSQLQDAIVEEVYYRLRWRPKSGFNHYYTYAEEAIESGDEVLLALLRAELLSFWADYTVGQENTSQIGDLRWVDVQSELATRWVKLLYSREKLTLAYKKALALRGELFQDLIEPSGQLAIHELNIWLAITQIYLGEIDTPNKMLNASIKALDKLRKEKDRSRRAVTVLATGYNILGYLRRTQYQHRLAADEYAKAIPLWQKIQLKVRAADSLKNRAFALSKIGLYHTAIPLVTQALQINEELGPRIPVGLSVNTLAAIELDQNALGGARRDAHRAYDIFKGLRGQRGLGLSLIMLAEATRRSSMLSTYIQEQKSADMLVEAVSYASQAVAIFQTLGEKGRIVEARQALGRCYRAWAQRRQEHPNILAQDEQNAPREIDELIAKSRIEFTKAAQQAQSNPYSYMNILLDQGSLEYITHLYIDAPNFQETKAKLEINIFRKIEQLVREEYRAVPSIKIQRERFWDEVVMGQLHVLRGHIAFHEWKMSKTEDLFERSISHYTRGLVHYHVFSRRVIQEQRQSLDEIHGHLTQLSQNEKSMLYETVEKIERRYNLGVGQSRMSEYLEERIGKFVSKEMFEFEVDD